MTARTSSVDDLIAFYDRRGYKQRIGAGASPALVVIDFSRAFTEGEGAFPGGDFAPEIAATRRLLDAARARAVPVVFTTIAYVDVRREAPLWHAKAPWLEHCRAGSALVEIDPRLAPAPAEQVLVKRYPSAFFATDLEPRLRAAGVDTVIIAGCTTSVCVRATTIDAMQRDFRPLLAREAIGEFDPALHALHLKDLDSRYADVMPVDALVAYLGR